MKFKLGDNVIVTAGKDKGLKAKILKTYPKDGTVVVEGANMYTRNFKPQQGQPGRQVRRERPLDLAKVAIVNDKGQADRIGYSVGKDGSKARVFKKTGSLVPEPKAEKATK